MRASWRRELRRACNGSLDHVARRAHEWLAELGIVRRRRSPWRAALSVAGAAAAGALLLALLTGGTRRAEP